MCGYFLARSRLTPAGMVPTKGRYDPGGPTQKEFAAKLADMQRRARRESAELESQLAASNREREELRKKAEGAVLSMTPLDPKLVKQVDELGERLKAATLERDEALQNLEKMKQDLESVDKKAVSRLESEQSSLEKRRTRLEHAQADLDMAQKELKRTRAKLVGAEKARQETEARVRQMHKRLKELETGEFATEEPTLIRKIKAGEDSTDQPEIALDGDDSLQDLLEKLVIGEGASSAVLADHMGLSIVGSGAHHEELAAAAALLSDTGQRMAALLEFNGKLPRISLIDENSMTAEVYPFSAPHGPLILATLAVRPGPDMNLVTQAMEHVYSLVK